MVFQVTQTNYGVVLMLRSLLFVILCLSLSGNTFAQKVKVTTLYCDGQGADLELVGDQVVKKPVSGTYYAFQVVLSDPEVEVVINGLTETYAPYTPSPLNLPMENEGPNRLSYGDFFKGLTIARGSHNYYYI